MQEVGGSSPLTPTKKQKETSLRCLFLFLSGVLARPLTHPGAGCGSHTSLGDRGARSPGEERWYIVTCGKTHGLCCSDTARMSLSVFVGSIDSTTHAPCAGCGSHTTLGDRGARSPGEERWYIVTCDKTHGLCFSSIFYQSKKYFILYKW